MLRTCATCGQPMTSTAAFCGNCGRPAWRACPHCGGPIAEGARWCGTCGADLAGFAGVPAVTPPPQPTHLPVSPAPAPQLPQPAGSLAAPPSPGARSSRRPIPPVALALAAVVVLVAGALGTGIVKLPGAGTPSGPVQSPPAGAAVGTPANQSTLLPAPDEGGIPAPGETKALTGSLTLGAAGTASSTTIGSAGGTVSASGLSLAFPAATLTADIAVAVSTTPISGLASDSAYGGALTPLTPLYTVDTGNATLSSPVTVTLSISLPAQRPASAVALAFYYDPGTGALTPLGPLSDDGSHIVALASHFSDILGVLVDLAKLPDIVDSGFRPGTDDWEFPNYGSYVALPGQCEGQSASEIWYYVHQHRENGAASLYGHYDNNSSPNKTPTLWQDDSQAYRFVGSVHADPVAVPFTYNFLKNAMLNAADGSLTYDAFKAAIAFSSEPQLILIEPGGAATGHAMVVYRVTPQWLLVADPNYPGVGRRIRYDPASGKLGPFVSGNSVEDIAAGDNTTYTHFAYVPEQSSVSDEKINAHWEEFVAGTAGDAVFPSYSLSAQVPNPEASGETNWVPLTDNFSTDQASLLIQLSKLSNGASAVMLVYPSISPTPVNNKWNDQQTLELDPGENNFGLDIYGWTGKQWAYVDFKRFTIVRGPAASASAATASAAGGHWVLTSATSSLGGPGTTGDLCRSLDSSNGQIIYHGSQDCGDLLLNGTVSWNPLPPASAAPGDVWNTTLSAQLTCSSNSRTATSGAWELSVFILYATTSQHLLSLTCGQGSGSVKASYVFPPATDDNVTYIGVVGGAAGELVDTWLYTYTWQP